MKSLHCNPADIVAKCEYRKFRVFLRHLLNVFKIFYIYYDSTVNFIKNLSLPDWSYNYLVVQSETPFKCDKRLLYKTGTSTRNNCHHLSPVSVICILNNNNNNNTYSFILRHND